MPELPEVETVARDLHAALGGWQVVGVDVRQSAVIAAPEAVAFAADLTGQTVLAVRRRAKYIVVDLADGGHLVVHLRMTGRLVLAEAGAAPLKHTHVVLQLRNQGGEERALHFHDTRRFGRLWLLDAAGLDSLFASLGPEPLEDRFSRQTLASLLAGRSTKLKPLLLDQTRLAGLGNIYVDEALFHAGLHPTRQAKSLSASEVDRLYQAIRHVLGRAVAHRGTSLSDAEYRDAQGNKGGHQDHVAVFRRQGRPCPRCGAVIQRTRLAGRGTHFCPQCQPAPC
jgi:formamidopyrimidine-DNA glycosylase